MTIQRLQLTPSHEAAKLLFLRCLHCVLLIFINFLILIRNSQMFVDSK